ncbi:alkaline phosphatase PhoX [Haloferula sp.]|uniref:alkaline phosphatase PhoX n=1 Tax=Haloferula sp. TaxID=2497595 RepID=UPI00329C0C7C
MIPRRKFLGTAGLAFLGLQRYAQSAPSSRVIEPHGPLIPDPDKILDLPKGFSYRIISKRGDRMTDGFKVPGKHDGMAAFPGPDGKVVLVRNHELRLKMTGEGPFANNFQYPKELDLDLSHDPGKGGKRPYIGGTTNVVFDPKTGEVITEFLSLTGTDTNCAGGAMPWGTWITCEETENLTQNSRALNHGWCFEVKATAEPGLQKAIPIKALGRFRHEAVALDPDTGILYLTEDRGDGLLYRFIPDKRNDFHSGKLQALTIEDQPKADIRNYNPADPGPKEGDSMKVGWIDLEDTHAPKDDLRYRGFEAGATKFARGEGIHHTPEGIFLCCTDGGPTRRGQLFQLKPSGSADKADTLTLFLQPEKNDLLTNGDNLCPAPWGDLVICEDLIDPSFGEHTHVRCVTPEGKIHTLARNARDKSEFAGSCFSPDGKWLFVNLQHHGLTFAITGPWQG